MGEVAVVMVPFPEMGHLIPLLRLSSLISSSNIPVYYYSVAGLSHKLKLQYDPFPTNIHFHDISEASIGREFAGSDKGFDTYHAYMNLLREPLLGFCRQLSESFTRVVIIHDAMIPSIVSEIINHFETYMFHVVSAFTIYSMINQVTEHDSEFLLQFQAHIPKVGASYSELEGSFLEALAKLIKKPLWGLGPLNPLLQDSSSSSSSEHRCIEWLYKQPHHSVIYVSFGTVASYSPEQIHELALGLERSQHKFIWVLREKNHELPVGLEERVSGRGIIARDWVPQLEILAHPSTAAYLFHSGWNSFLESITMGVPMITLPFTSDNPYNDVLITKVLKVGVAVKDWATGDDGHHELVTSDTLEKAITFLMDSTEGEEMRQRAAALSKAIRDGGTMQKQMDSFVAHITRS